MSGWDREPGYTPPPPPAWLWLAAAAFLFGPFAAWLLFG